MNNYPDGCTQRDIDEAAGGYERPECIKCGETPCECCIRCGASPAEACAEDCGIPDPLDEPAEIDDALMELWAERSELFEPSDCFEIGHIVEGGIE